MTHEIALSEIISHGVSLVLRTTVGVEMKEAGEQSQESRVYYVCLISPFQKEQEAELFPRGKKTHLRLT